MARQAEPCQPRGQRRRGAPAGRARLVEHLVGPVMARARARGARCARLVWVGV